MKSIDNVLSLIICTFFFSTLAYSQGGYINLGTVGNRRVVRPSTGNYGYAGAATISSRRSIIRDRNTFGFPLNQDQGRFTKLPQRMGHESRRFSSSDPLSNVTSLRQLREYRERIRSSANY